MSGQFDINATINDLLARTMRSPEQQAAAFTQVSMMLGIPIQLADARGAQAQELVKRNRNLKNEILDARQSLAMLEEKHAAGEAKLYQVEDARDELEELLAERNANKRIVAAAKEFHLAVTEKAQVLLNNMS